MRKVAIIGAGSVGSTAAYACLLRRVASTIVMVDCNHDRVVSEVSDLVDAAFLSRTVVKVGDLQEAGSCDVIVVTAGAKQKPGETRLDLIGRNQKILTDIFNGMNNINPNAIILLVANPVDVLTTIAQKISSLPRNQIIGSGTYLDTCRLRYELANVLELAPTCIHASVLGEHGDSQFIAWSCAHVAGIPLREFKQIQDIDKKELGTRVAKKAYSIIASKGSTFYGIGGVISDIIDVILSDSHTVLPISHYIPKFNVCLSLPAIIGKSGIIDTLYPPLSNDELALLEASAKEILKASP
jgi:L-lactate dehydrogenase